MKLKLKTWHTLNISLQNKPFDQFIAKCITLIGKFMAKIRIGTFEEYISK